MGQGSTDLKGTEAMGIMSWGWTINWTAIVAAVAVLAFLTGLGCGMLLTLHASPARIRHPRKDEA